MSVSNLSSPNSITGYIGTLTADNITVNNLATIPNINISGDLNTSGKISVTNNDHDSIKTSGGLEVTEDIKCKNITISNTLTAQTIAYEQTEVIQSTDDSNGLNSGASQCKGGASINKQLFIGSPVHCLSTVNSTDKNDPSASLVVAGGASISSSVYCDSVNGNVNTNSITSHLNDLQIHSTSTTLTNLSCSTINAIGGTPSSDYQHGDIVISGGLGITNNINTLGNITSQGILGGKTLNITNDGDVTGTLTTGNLKMINTVNKISKDSLMAENSDSNLSTEKATKGYMDTHINNSTTAHFSQNLASSGQPSFNGLSITNNDITLFNGEPQGGKGINGVENTRIRLTPTDINGVTSYIKKTNDSITLDSNGSITNQDYNTSYPRSRLTVGSNLKVSNSLTGVTAVTDTLTIDNTKVNILQSTASTTTTDGALVLSNGGLGVNGKVNALDVGVPNSSSINTFVNTTNKKLNSIISIKSFCVGDGLVDDTIGVQAFFNAVTASPTAGVGYIPTGQYKCTSNIIVDFVNIQFTGCLFYGDGKNQSTFQMNACSFIWKNSGGPTTYDIGLNNFSIQGTYDGGAICDFQNGYRDCFIQNMIMYNHSINPLAISCQIFAFIASTMMNCDILGQGAAYGVACLQLINASGSTWSGIYCARYATALNILGTSYFVSNTFNAMDLEYCVTSVSISSANCTNNVFNGSILSANNTNGINATAGSSNIFITPSITQAKITNSTGVAIFGNSTSTAGTMTVPNLNVGITGQTMGLTFNEVATTSSLNYYEVFSQVLVFTSGSGSPSISCVYTRVGKLVTLMLIQGALVNGNAPISRNGCIPTRFLPVASIDCPITVTSNSIPEVGRFTGSSITGNVIIYRNYPTTSFQNNCAVGIIGGSATITYLTA